MAYNPPLQTTWIENGINNDLISWANNFGRFLTETKKPLTTTQLRRFFGEMKRISLNFSENKDSIYMLEPKLAYAVGRVSGDDKGRIKEFYEELSRGLRIVCTSLDTDAAKAEKQFKNFIKVAEAIVAYHKANGGN